MKKLLLLIVIAAGTVYLPPPAAAQSGTTMLMPGVYTTADISRRCQAYVNRNVRSSGSGDTQRQAVFINCVRRLYGDQYGAAPAPVADAPLAAATVVTAPITGLAYATTGYAPAWEGYGSVYGYTAGQCLTDEGFGRIGLCSGVVQ